MARTNTASEHAEALEDMASELGWLLVRAHRQRVRLAVIMEQYKHETGLAMDATLVRLTKANTYLDNAEQLLSAAAEQLEPLGVK